MVKGKSNPVAKFSKQFNKGGPMRDRKKDDKRGYEKHKKPYKEDDQQTDTSGHTNSAAKRPQNYFDPETGKTKTRMVPVHKNVQNEKLNPSDGIKAYIDDFKKSDAPQFKGKSDAKKKEMAIAAYLDAKKGEKKESVDENITRRTVSYGQGPKKKLGQIQIKKPSAGSRPNPGASKNLKKNMSAAEKEKEAAKVKKALDREKKKDKPGMTKRSDDYNKKKYQSGATGKYFSRLTKKEACWTGYRQAGMKKKGDKVVPNCVPESTNAYGKSQDAIRLKKQKAAMTPSDRDKMSKVADMMRREREKRAAQHRNETKEEAYNPRAARAQSHAANKMYGRTSDPIDKKPASAAKKPISKASLFKAIDKKYGSAKKKTGIFKEYGGPKMSKDDYIAYGKKYHANKTNEDAEARARLKLKHTKEKENLKNRHSKEREAMKETMDPRDFTDKPGHVVVVKKKDGTKSIKHYHPTSAGAKKYADRVNKVNRVGDKATVHKTDGRKIHEASQKLTNKRAELRKKMFGDANYLSPAQRKELDKAAKAALKKDSASKKAAPPKPVSKTSKGKVRTGSADPADRNIFMQLRKAQDRGGNQSITVTPTGKKVTLNPKQIDMLLKRHDSIQKPVDKRKFKIMLIKSLRAKAK
jgi:hypothetical protein